MADELKFPIWTGAGVLGSLGMPVPIPPGEVTYYASEKDELLAMIRQVTEERDLARAERDLAVARLMDEARKHLAVLVERRTLVAAVDRLSAEIDQLLTKPKPPPEPEPLSGPFWRLGEE